MTIKRLSFADKLKIVRWMETNKAEAERQQSRAALAKLIHTDTGTHRNHRSSTIRTRETT